MHLIPFLAVAIFLALIYAFSRYRESQHDPKEPPFLPQKIPFIGHIIRMIQQKTRYYVHLRYPRFPISRKPSTYVFTPLDSAKRPQFTSS